MTSVAGILDVIVENLFVIIILVNIFFRLFAKKPEEEQPLGTSEIDWFDLEEEEGDAELGSWEDFGTDPVSKPAPRQSSSARTDAQGDELSSRVRELIDFAVDSLKEDDRLLKQLKEMHQQSPGLHILIPSLEQFYLEVLKTQEVMRVELKRIERAFYEREALSRERASPSPEMSLPLCATGAAAAERELEVLPYLWPTFTPRHGEIAAHGCAAHPARLDTPNIARDRKTRHRRPLLVCSTCCSVT